MASPNSQLAPELEPGREEPVLREAPPLPDAKNFQLYPIEWKDDPDFRPHEIAGVYRFAAGQGEAKLQEFSNKFRTELRSGQEDGQAYDYIVLYRKDGEHEAG